MELIANGTQLITVVGLLAFTVSVITQVTKGIGLFRRVHTRLQVLVLSIVITLLAAFAYIDMKNLELCWYYIAGAAVLSFFVAFVATYGWEKIVVLWDKYREEK